MTTTTTTAPLPHRAALHDAYEKAIAIANVKRRLAARSLWDGRMEEYRERLAAYEAAEAEATERLLALIG